VAGGASVLGAFSFLDRVLDLLHAPDAKRRQQGFVFRQEPCPPSDCTSEESHIQRCCRCRRSQGRTSGNYRLFEGAAEVPEAGWPYSERRLAGGSPGYRKDAACARDCWRSQCPVLLDQWIGFRRNVRGRRRLACARPVRTGKEKRAVHHFYR